jgi:hypothetical protein
MLLSFFKKGGKTHMSQMNHFMADVYPGQGFFNTRTITTPEAEDQTALVDDQKLAEKNPVAVDPASHKKIWISMAAVVGVIILLNIKI